MVERPSRRVADECPRNGQLYPGPRRPEAYCVEAIQDAAIWFEGLDRLGKGYAEGTLPDELFDDAAKRAAEALAGGRSALARPRPSPRPELLTLMAGQQ